ncbi:tripartite motif-containing protein 16-like, partial [Cyprinus carpio]|uniref:Tripartite motif-containing protein 16-like n=1 Tax=Cyprinus carpio TaxID=7962 RepID=A0A9Q9ZR89_CYPCA
SVVELLCVVSLYSCSKMAEARISQDEFMCPVCLDLLKDPVTIQCGHSYCKSCIEGSWDQEDQTRVYSCPQCRETFSPRPALARNTMLAELVEKLKKRKRPADCDAGAGDVQCDVCTGRKYKAVKSCLMCQESYCQIHFDIHEEFHLRKSHKVIDAPGRLKEMICQKHEKHMEMYCITDQQCICELCTKYEHKNHNTVSAAAQRTEKQKQLKETQKTLQQRIQQREKDLQQLRETVESHKRSTQTAVEDSERIFTELIRYIERSRSELIRLIRDQEKTAVSRAEEQLERLEQEINDLRRRDAELEQLSHTQDHIQFLQSFQSLSAPPESTDVNDDLFSSLFSSDALRESVHQLRDKLEDFCKEELKKISDRVTFTNIVLWTRKDFLQYSRQLTLDLNTAHKRLRLSENNRVITETDTVQPYPDHPDRFDVSQVLCRESVCGRCYWELQWSGDKGVCITVSYKSISRKGSSNECSFGCNDQSWNLDCSHSSYSFGHNNIWTDLPVKSISSRIGVFVDHSAGTLSFYSVSDTMSLNHTVQTTFTQPLYPGFGVYIGSSVKLC